MAYKGFTGTFEFSEEDNVFYGKISNIKGLVDFEGSSIDECKGAFEQAVEDYIMYCKEEGITPKFI